MIRRVVATLVIAQFAPSNAAPGPQRLVEAERCSDEVLRYYASRTCESLDDVTALAVQKCQSKWSDVVTEAVGPAPRKFGSYEEAENYIKKLRGSTEGYEGGYKAHAKLRAMDFRANAGSCAPK